MQLDVRVSDLHAHGLVAAEQAAEHVCLRWLRGVHEAGQQKDQGILAAVLDSVHGGGASFFIEYKVHFFAGTYGGTSNGLL
jgi:hypothetical protein